MNWIKGLFVSMGVVGFLAFTILMVFLGGITLHYDITWLQMYTHHTVSSGMLFWIVCLIAGLWVGGISIPLALILWIIGLFS